MYKLEIQQTADGSPTLFVPEMDEHYHSVNGAIQEAKHVYIEAGFNQCSKSSVRVLELGFGTGLNAILTCLEAEKRKIDLEYTAFELFPLPASVYQHLDYTHSSFPTNYPSIFQQMHQSEWNKRATIKPGFSLLKIHDNFTKYNFGEKGESYDVVYYDAFAPDKQPDAWSQEIFDLLYASMNAEGILTTYCAKGIIRRMMLTAGFEVERIPGPPGKRQMLRAIKPG